MATDLPSRLGNVHVATAVDDELPLRLREARLQSGLSLRALAKRLDVSASALSQIETGRSRPSVRTLYALVTALGLSLDDLFADRRAPELSASAAGRDGIVRRRTNPSRGDASPDPVMHTAGRPSLELATGVTWERLTVDDDPQVDFLHVTYKPGSASNANGLVRHSGHEYGIVMSGEIEVTVGFETHRLGPGDSISFSSEEPHVLVNRGSDPASAIWFVVGRRQLDGQHQSTVPSI